MPNIAPVTSKNDPMTRFGTKKLHRYFDETTIYKYYSKYPKKRERTYPANYHLYLQKYHKKIWGTQYKKDIGNEFNFY